MSYMFAVIFILGAGFTTENIINGKEGSFSIPVQVGYLALCLVIFIHSTVREGR